MPEQETAAIADTEFDTHWSDAHEAITGDEALANFAKKFDSPDAMCKSGYELEQKLGHSFRLPDDLSSLTDEQKATLHERVRSLRNIPETADGYEITRPEKMPEGMPYNEALETAFKAFAFERGWDAADVNELAGWFNNSLISMFEAKRNDLVKAANEAERDYRIKCGADYDVKMKGITKLRMHVAEHEGLTYTNDKGELCSELDDALDAVGINGKVLGNNPAIMKMLSYIYETFRREADPPDVEGGLEGGKLPEGWVTDYTKVDKD